MKLLRGYKHLAPITSPTIATIGNFDGFHLGHQKIIRYVTGCAKENQLDSVLISFQPTAKEFFTGANAPGRIYPIRKKIELAQSFGLDYFACLRFNESLANMEAVDFVQQILHNALQVKKLVVGDDFKFGHHRHGSLELLHSMGKSLGFEVENIQSMLHDKIRVSSTLIRDKLAVGAFEEVAKLLGRPFSISGRVFHGDKKGRTIGFPTANILLRRKVSPITGVFTITASNQSQQWQGVANVGKRPTVNGQRLQLEAHLFNCQENLYTQRLDVQFHSKLRDEIKFSSFDALQHQITLDVGQAKNFFSERN